MEKGHDHKQDTQSIRMIASIKKHLQAFNAMRVTIENWDPILVNLVTHLLDDNTLQLWESNSIIGKNPTFDELSQFLTTRYRVLESLEIKIK